MNLGLLLPEWILLGTLLLVVLAEVIQGQKPKEAPALNLFSRIAYRVGALLALGALFTLRGKTEAAFGGMFITDAFAVFFKIFFILTLLAIIPMSRIFLKDHSLRPDEYFLILWTTLLGLFFLVSANDLLLMFIALEVVTLSFYIMTAYLKKDLFSIEAGIKYLILGSVASALMIYGISLVYLSTGTVSFGSIREVFAGGVAGPQLTLGVLFILSALAFKVGSVPFQLWVPDVYQGAPTPVTAFLSVGSKAAGVAVLLRVLFSVLPGWNEERILIFSTLAVMTMIYGHFGALRQDNIKRLFGYSGIAHAGYLLLGAASGTINGTAHILLYLIAYALANLAAFYVITICGRAFESDQISHYGGLARKSPFLAASLFIALISLAGVPPVGGFFGKFLILITALKSGMSAAVLIGLFGVVVSLYYYLGVVKVLYMDQPIYNEKIAMDSTSRNILMILTAATLLIGVAAEPLLNWVRIAASSLF